ncbi:acyl-CoA dehydrogenase family protein [Sporosarcina sp.]|uniref:acyl-CoA dehydrogenase family protein n=1 Tax=Sporosarcina sp. TaxID=49982 RepID=UPI00260D34AA|nr:acyl-CoA dehydrogenase family protein [Sporosarcina sp.]
MKRTFLTEEHELFRTSVQKFLRKEAVPYLEDWEKDKQVPRSFWKKAAAQGFLAPSVDEKYGGFHADFGYAVVISEEFEKVASGLGGIGLHNDIVIPYIQSFGSEEQKERWLTKAVTGEMISAIAMTEPGTGSDLAAVQTTAVRDGERYIMNGEKTFITNGYSADLVIVVCKTDPNASPAHKGISLLIVEEGTPGFTKGKKLNKVGQHANDTCELLFEDVSVPAENLLGEEGKGFYYLMEKLQQERLMCSIQSIASVQRMIDITLDYVKERQAFGKRIGDFQNTQFKLAEMQTRATIGRTFVDRLIVEHMNGGNVVNEVSMAKWWTTDLAQTVAVDCMQFHGGYGYMEEYEIARRYRDVAVNSIYAGSNEIMKVIIAKNLGL